MITSSKSISIRLSERDVEDLKECIGYYMDTPSQVIKRAIRLLRERVDNAKLLDSILIKNNTSI